MNNTQYTWIVGTEQYKLPSQYKLIQMLGKGAYGYVINVFDKHDKTHYAIKKCKSVTKSKQICKRTMREIKILRLLDHDNIIKMKSILKPQDDDFNDIYIVFELMHCDLNSLIKSQQNINQEVVKHLSKQLFTGLQYLHGMGIVHRDLKSKNILINLDCSLKIADFGLARCYLSNEQRVIPQTDYITTRWYRAPEIFLGHGLHQMAIDLWACGCILSELIIRRNLFSGSDSFEMLTEMNNLIGSPEPLFLENCRKEKYVEFLRNINIEKPHLQSLISNQDFYDLVSKLLTWEPEKRLASKEALHHPALFWADDNCIINETSSSIEILNIVNSFELFEQSFDSRALNVKDFRCYMLREINSYHNKEEIYGALKGSIKIATNRIEDDIISKKCIIV